MNILSGIKKLFFKDSAGMTGRMRITVRDSITGQIISESPWYKNKIVSSSGYGRNIIMRQLANDTTYSIPVTAAVIGTGTTAPADSDVALVAQNASFSITSTTVSNNQVTFSIFMTDALLANGTYGEFGLKCNTQLFSRVLISPTFTKTSNQNTTIDYIVTLT